MNRLRTMAIAAVLAALLVLVSCGGGTTDDSDFEEVLASLGVDVSAVASRSDPNGNAVDEDVNPFGSTRTVIAKDAEIFFKGAYVNSDTTQTAAAFVGYDGAAWSVLKTDTDDAWAQLYGKCTAADLDADGYDEVVAMYYDPTDQTVQIRELRYNDATFVDRSTFSCSAAETIESTSSCNFLWRQCIAAGDIDGDGKDEIVATTGLKLVICDDNYSTLVEGTIDPIHTIGDAIVRTACADFDGDGKDEIIVVNGAYLNDQSVAELTIYSYSGGSLSALFDSAVQASIDGSTHALQGPSIATGDIDGDQIPEVIFCGDRANHNHALILVLDVSMDTSSEPVFEFLDGAVTIEDNTRCWYSLACGDMDDDGMDEIACWDGVYGLVYSDDDQAWTLGVKWGPGSIEAPFEDMLAMGDVDDDGLDEIVLFDTDREDLYVYGVDSSGALAGAAVLDTTVPSDWGSGCLCLPDVDKDSSILAYQSHVLTFTSPRIVTVMASPPYWDGIDQNIDATQIEWGTSNGDYHEDETSYGFSVGVTVGYHWGDPLLDTYSVDLKATVTNKFTWSSSNSVEVTVTKGYTCPAGENQVIFSVVPFDVYYYEIVSSPTATEIGDIVPVSVPRTPIMLSADVEWYNQHNGDGQDVDSTILTHTIGDPFSYPTTAGRDTIRAAVSDGLYTYQADDAMTVGQGDGSTSVSIESLQTESSSFSYELDVGVEFEAEVTGVIFGASAEFQYEYSYTNAVTEGTYVAVTIGNISDEDYSEYLFTYGLMAYPTSLGDQQFTLVTCWVEDPF